jgi:hypothetical protein
MIVVGSNQDEGGVRLNSDSESGGLGKNLGPGTQYNALVHPTIVLLHLTEVARTRSYLGVQPASWRGAQRQI